MKYILARFTEPSTWAAIAVLAAAFGADPTKIQTIVGAITGVIAAIAVVLPEKGKKDE